MNAELLESPVVALEPELGSVTTVQALAVSPRAVIKAAFSKSFINRSSGSTGLHDEA
jgi:hypothetical protein